MANAARMLLLAAAFTSAGWTAPPALPGGLAAEPVATRAVPLGHGPPDTRQLYICRVEPRYGGDFCTSPPYAPVGKRCTCEGPNGPRPGHVEHR